MRNAISRKTPLASPKLSKKSFVNIPSNGSGCTRAGSQFLGETRSATHFCRRVLLAQVYTQRRTLSGVPFQPLRKRSAQARVPVPQVPNRPRSLYTVGRIANESTH